MPYLALVDGTPKSVVSLDNRGLAYGDGLFETIAFRNRKLKNWQRHMTRLQHGCRTLRIAVPDPETLQEECLRSITGETDGVIKIILTREPGGRGYTPMIDRAATRLIQSFPWPDGFESGRTLEVGVCETRLGSNPALAGLKHLNRLEQVLGANEVVQHGWDEGLLLDSLGHPVCGTKANFFYVTDGKIYTPSLTKAGVEGVIKATVKDTATILGITVIEDELSFDALTDAEEMFFTNAIIGVVGVSKFIHPINGPIDLAGASGSITNTLARELAD